MQGGAGLDTRREDTGEVATLEELGKRELRGGISERGCQSRYLCCWEYVLHGDLH